MKSFMDELTRYRVKVERDGKEIVNVPGILALPGLLIAPKMSIVGMFAAPLLGCSVHVVDADGKAVDVGKKVQEAADSIVDTAKKTAATIKEEMDKAWESVSADDPADEPEANPEKEGEPAQESPADIVKELEKHEADEEIPTIHAKPEGPGKSE